MADEKEQSPVDAAAAVAATLSGIDDEPVERRATPRAPTGGLEAEVMLGQTWIPVTVREISVASLFVEGDGIAALEVGGACGLRLAFNDERIHVEARCARREDAPRTGVVLTLSPDDLIAHSFITLVLEPSTVPPGVD